MHLNRKNEAEMLVCKDIEETCHDPSYDIAHIHIFKV